MTMAIAQAAKGATWSQLRLSPAGHASLLSAAFAVSAATALGEPRESASPAVTRLSSEKKDYFKPYSGIPFGCL